MRVEVLFGQLERSVAVWINSTETSTATPDIGIIIIANVYTCIHHYSIKRLGVEAFAKQSEMETFHSI